MTTAIGKWIANRQFVAGTVFVSLVMAIAASPAYAGQVNSLDWKSKGNEPVVDIGLTSKPSSYVVKSFDSGRRLRLTLGSTTVGPDVPDLSAAGIVKGVYPYLAGDGVSSNIDFLLTQPGQLSVDAGRHRFRVTVKKGAAAPTAGTNSQTGNENAITNVQYTMLPGDRVQIRLTMAQTPFTPRAFTIDKPASISFDFANTLPHLAKMTVPIQVGAVDSVNVVTTGNRTRVVLALYESAPYTTEVQHNAFVITVASPSESANATQPTVTHFAAGEVHGKYSLDGIDFRRDGSGGAKIMLKLSNPAAGVDIHQQEGDIVVDLLNTSAPERLQKRLDVTDFGTPVQFIDTFPRGRNTRIVITPHGEYQHMAYQAGDVFTVDVKPINKAQAAAEGEGPKYTGEKLSLDFQKISVRDALQVLADFTGLNFIISDSVSGNITLRLKDVPWDQALAIILQTKNLGMRKQGNVVMIAPASELAAQEKAKLEAEAAKRKLEPLVSELIQINYAKAADIAALLKSVKPLPSTTTPTNPFQMVQYSGAQKTISNSLLSPRGQVTVDTRTNSILIQDTPSKIAQVRKLIAKLDKPIKQVMIEARLVEATSSFARSLGSRFGVTNAQFGANGAQSVTGNLEGNVTILNNGYLTANTNGLNVNLPSPGIGTLPAGQIAYTLATGGELLQLELSALEQEGEGKIISSPRIITGNQETAEIQQGQERMFSLGAGMSKTQTATLELKVTPQITPDRRVMLNVLVTKNSFADANNGLINKKSITTNVLLNNGETVAIGGVYEQDKTDTVTQVPLFGRLPLIGWMFKEHETTNDKDELLIFLTPRILTDDLTLH